MTDDHSTGDKRAPDPATLIRQVRVLERKLARSEESRVRLEEAKDRFDALHRNLFRELDEQKALVDEKNKMLESLSLKLRAAGLSVHFLRSSGCLARNQAQKAYRLLQ